MTIAKGPRRSPRGTLVGKPVYVHLTKTERTNLERAASEQNLSLSRTARMFLVLGMATATAARKTN